MSRPIDLMATFNKIYANGITDPVLKQLLEAIAEHDGEVQKKFLLEAYAPKAEYLDGFYEVLRRHLLGPLYPGPVMSVAEASLREGAPVLIDDRRQFELRTGAGETLLLSANLDSWLVPSRTNEISVEEKNGDLWLGFHLVEVESEDDSASTLLHTPIAQLSAMEKLKCTEWWSNGEHNNGLLLDNAAQERDASDNIFPAELDGSNPLHRQPLHAAFARLPLRAFAAAAITQPFAHRDSGYWYRLPKLGSLKTKLQSRLLLNCFPVWNLVRMEEQNAPKRRNDCDFKLDAKNPEHSEIFIHRVEDQQTEQSIRYLDERRVLDPGYPHQFSYFRDDANSAGVLRLSQPPKGPLRVVYYQYDRRDEFVDHPARELGFHDSPDNLNTVQLRLPLTRLRLLQANDPEASANAIWGHFRSLLNSRGRLVTEGDLRHALEEYLAMLGFYRNEYGNIRLARKLGRVNGALTPFVDIMVPVYENRRPLQKNERDYYEQRLRKYLQSRSPHGHYLNVRLAQNETEA